MSLTGLEFLFFLPVVLLLHWAGPRRAAWQNTVLLLASYVFYLTWDPAVGWAILLSTAVDYAVGLYLAAHPGEGRGRRVALGASVAFNVGFLGFFKYAGFFATSLNDLLGAVGLPASVEVLKVALPIGISYYTLQKLSYSIDLYYDRIPACRNALTFATFVAFFPQIVCGPITRARDMVPQFSRPRALDAETVAAGGRAFLLGFFMKAYVADRLGSGFVDPVFGEPGRYGALSHWVALLAYAVHVFCDFGGYSFMAIGVGRVLGIELPLNFDRPFLSRSMLEFWRRWHITLNTWLFDYLFAPMVTGHGRMRNRFALGFMIVFMISGLWHGPYWTFVLWGLLHGVALAVNRQWDETYKGLCRRDRAWVARRRSAPYALAAWAVTQLFFVLTLVPFRAPSLERAWEFARGLLGGGGEERMHVASLHLLVAAVFMVVYHGLEVGPGQRLKGRFTALPAPVRGLAYGLLLVFLLIFVPVGESTFVYAQF